MRIAAVQSNFLPWIGYFDLISSVDTFVILDTVQYTKRDWRNRNRVMGPNGVTWMTVPVETKGKREQKIVDTRIAEPEWVEAVSKTLEHSYGKAPYFAELFPKILEIFEKHRLGFLSPLNKDLIEMISSYLGIKTRVISSADLSLKDGKSERLLDLSIKLGASEYLSGRLAQSYLDESLFTSAGVRVSWIDYGTYPPHSGVWGESLEPLSVVDGLFSMGNGFGEGRLYRL